MPPRTVFTGMRSPTQTSRVGEGSPGVQKESDVTESEFSRWKVAVENRMKADELRAEADEKKAFKDAQIAAKKERQERIQAQVKEQRLAARAKVDSIKAENLEKGAGIKDFAVKSRQHALKQKTAYAEAGYELTRLHGPEQAKRTASRYVELARQKASFGQGGKEDRMALATQRIQQRTARLEEKRQLVEKLKADEESAPMEAKKWATNLKKNQADNVRVEEKQWKEDHQNQLNDFLYNQKNTHTKIDATKTKAKNVRMEIQTQHQKAAAKEREAAKQHEASLHDGDNSRISQLKMNHDLLFAKKFTAEANAELVKQPLAQAVQKMRQSAMMGIEDDDARQSSRMTM